MGRTIFPANLGHGQVDNYSRWYGIIDVFMAATRNCGNFISNNLSRLYVILMFWQVNESGRTIAWQWLWQQRLSVNLLDPAHLSALLVSTGI